MKQIIEKINPLLPQCVPLEIIETIDFPYTYGHKFRYRHVLNCVKHVLNINYESNYDDNIIDYFNKPIKQDQFYYFLKEVYSMKEWSDLEKIEEIYQKYYNKE